MESVIVNLKNTLSEMAPLVDDMCGKTQCGMCVMCCDEGCAWINLRECLGV